MKRREFTRAQRAAIVHRAMNQQTGHLHCEGCSGALKRGDWEIDHQIPEALIADKTRPLTIEDGKLLGKSCCHRGENGKTAQDVATIAKVYRCEAAHLGTRKRTGNPIAGSKASGWRKPMNGPAVRRAT